MNSNTETSCNVVAYFYNSGDENIPKETKKFMDNKNITTNIYRIQTYDLLVWGYFCIKFIEFIFKGKRLTDFNKDNDNIT